MQNRHPVFSVIIPTFNRSKKLHRALESLSNQSIRDFEVLVCDDGSTDDTREIVASFKNKLNLTYFHEENWGGPARPRNNGIRAAQGKWICFLDADDWWYPEKLAHVQRRTPDADVIYHDGDIYSPLGKKLLVKMRSRSLHPPVFIEMMTKGNPFITSGICVRKRILDRTNGFLEDKALISVEDFDLWLKIALITERFVHIPLSLCGYWKGEGNLSETTRHIAAHAALFEMHREHLPPEARRKAEIFFSYCMGLAALRGRNFPTSREHLTISIKSHDLRLAAMSLIRIIESFWRQVSLSFVS
ncbi:MAG: glycosyltransferase family 2 protein [Smithellaceae bacterium]